jgi:hypothetical protein
MKKSIVRLINVLAAMEVHGSELMTLLSDLRELPIEEIYNRVLIAQSRLKDSLDLFDDDQKPYSRRVSYDPQQGVNIGDRVERLLRIEAGLTTSEAVKGLTKIILEHELIHKDDVPPLSRKSLGDWISRLSRYMKEKDILNMATVLRNAYVHKPVAAWNLSKR